MMLYEVALLLLFVKHWACDFVFQTPAMIAAKLQYRSWPSAVHGLHHAGITFLIFALGGIILALLLAVLDFVFHYHIDYAKAKYGETNSTTNRYWCHFGLDQLLHYLTYLVIVAIFIRIVE